MKKFIFVALLLLSSVRLFAQNNPQTQRGIDLYNNDRYVEAVACFQVAAKAGDAKAQAWLGSMYQEGEGVEKNTQIAINLYNKAIAQNFTMAMRFLGNMYRDGDGVGKDPGKAFALYKKAADLNDSRCLLLVASCYQGGSGVERDNIKAFDYLLLAAQSGNKDSYERLAFRYYSGNGTELSPENAAKYFELVGENRSDFGTYTLTDIYLSGSEELYDPIKAEELLRQIKDHDSLYAELYEKAKAAADRAMIETLPEFPGGREALMDFLSQNIIYPKKAEDAGIQGRVIISFTVSENGSIINPVVKQSVNPDLNAEALRLIKKMPRWIPGTSKGKDISVNSELPFNFRLD